MQQLYFWHIFLVLVISNTLFKCWTRFLCKVTVTFSVDLGKCSVGNQSLHLIHMVYRYMGGKDSRCVISHDFRQVTAVSCMTLCGEVSMEK